MVPVIPQGLLELSKVERIIRLSDRLIWKWLLEANDIEYNDSDEEVERIMSVYRQRIREGISKGHWRWEMLKNVNELLRRCAKEEDFVLALLTGNMIETAEVKLTNAGVEVEHFKATYGGKEQLLGGFGSDNMDRPTIVKIAMERMNKVLGCHLPPENFLIIGDTPKDIHCGHCNGIPALAVATGIYKYVI